MKNKKGFTLIELLAVIVILGIILVIAIPSISAAILNSRKNAYIATANEFVDGLRMMTLTNASLLPTDGSKECKALTAIKLEKGSNTKSPFGKKYTSDSKVCVKYEESKKDYTYSVCLIDEGGNGLSSNDVLNLSKSDVKLGNANCDELEGIVVGESTEWEVSEEMNSTGGYTLEKFIGDMEDSISVEVEKNYYNEANTSQMYLMFNEFGVEMTNKNAYIVNIPNMVNGKQITELDQLLFNAFDDYDLWNNPIVTEPYMRIKSFVIAEGIQKIFDINEDVESRGTFSYNVNLSSVTYPSTLNIIGNGSFAGTNITDIKIPKSITEIGPFAFTHFNNLNSIIFEGTQNGSSQLKKIGGYVFYSAIEPNVSPLDIIIPASVEEIGDSSFENNNITSLKFMGAEDGTSRLKNIIAFSFAVNNITSLTIPLTVEEIGGTAFLDNPLTSLNFVGTSTNGSGNDISKLTNIGVQGQLYTFDVSNIDSIIYLPSSLISIDRNQFSCDYRESTCTFYINHLSIPETFDASWAGSYARKYILNGNGGYTCIENCN